MLFLVLLMLFLINRAPENLKKSNTFWLASSLVEAESGKYAGSCMPPKLGNAYIIYKCKELGSFT